LLKAFCLQVVELLNPILPHGMEFVQELQKVLTVMEAFDDFWVEHHSMWLSRAFLGKH